MIGEIIKPHGVRGELRVEPYTSVVERFEWLEHVYVGNPPQRVGVDTVRYHQGQVLLKLSGDDTRDAAEARRGLQLYVPEDEAIPLGDDEYFLHDLIGLAVVDEQGAALGTLTEVLETGANNVFVVQSESSELLLPDIPDVIIDIDFELRQLTARLLPGMRGVAVE